MNSFAASRALQQTNAEKCRKITVKTYPVEFYCENQIILLDLGGRISHFPCDFRCRDCAAVLEEYDEETLGLAVVVLSMFIHLSPDLAAPMLLDIMQSVGR